MLFLYDLAPVLLAAAVFVGLWFWLRATATPLQSATELESRIGEGKPVVIRFFKNTWGGWLAANPVVNGIEDELQGLAEVVRVNLHTPVGREIARRYDVKSAKTTIVLDANGAEIYRHYGRPQRQKIIDLVRG